MTRIHRTLARVAATLAALTAAATFAVLPAAAASAATDTGWVRIAHLSPDTKAVDITLTSLSGSTVLYKLSDVAYGGVSPYMKLPEGTYTIAMVPAGDPADADPIVNASVSVVAGKAETVAALGLNDDLKTQVISDSLSDSVGSGSQVRIVQASTKYADVDVTSGSTALADNATFGSVTGYRALSAGTSTLTLAASSVTATATVQFAPGTQHTVFVLDTAKGGLDAVSALDSTAVTVAPVGSVDTGAGGVAGDQSAGLIAGGVAGGAALAAAAVGVLAVRRSRRPVAVAAAAVGPVEPTD